MELIIKYDVLPGLLDGDKLVDDREEKGCHFALPCQTKAIRSLPTIRTSGRARPLTLDQNVLVLVLGEVDAGLGRLKEHVLLITVQRPQLLHI